VASFFPTNKSIITLLWACFVHAHVSMRLGNLCMWELAIEFHQVTF
jgi:hypothetical protein